MSEPRQRLLVVDDNEDNRDLLARRLGRKGYDVDVAEDGPAALAAIAERSYDLVLLDVMMPGMSGLEVLTRIRESRSKAELPVIMATARAESEDVVSALSLGANDYVTKPIDFAVVLARVESHLQVKGQMLAAQKRAPVFAFDGSVEPGTVLDDRYEILSVIGEGGFAIVYKARQLSTGQVVALKLLRPHRMAALGPASVELRRFEREMKLIGSLSHPHVVRLIDSGSIRVERPRSGDPGGEEPPDDAARVEIPPTRAAGPGGRSEAPREDTVTVPYLVMEYLDGRPLSAILRAAGRLSVTQAVDLLVPVLGAVGEAHRAGVIHRDLKPPNILVIDGPHGVLHPKVLDFGIAKLADEETSGLTLDAGIVGTPEYMAPEQARGSREVTARSDQYALAVMLYECITGKRPFTSDSFMELVHLIVTGSFAPPSEVVDGVPPALEAVMLRAMHLDPAMRFRSLESFGAALLPFASPEVAAQWALAFHPESNPPPAERPTIDLRAVPQSRREMEEAETLVSDSMELPPAPMPEAPQPKPRRSRRTALGLAFVIGVGFAVYAVGSSGVDAFQGVPTVREATSVSVAGGPGAPESASYRVELRVRPEEAAIFFDGEPVGTGRFRRVLAKDGTPHTLRVEAPGYVTESIRFADVPPPAEIELAPLPSGGSVRTAP